MQKYYVAAFYQFADIADPADLKQRLEAVCSELKISGTILIATEGVNGTVAGEQKRVEELFAFLRREPGLEDITYKSSTTDESPFHRMKVRLKKEIVALGVPGCEPAARTAQHVSPAKWNDLIQDPDVLVIDARNDYEVDIGTFKGAINPQTMTFRQFPDYVKKELARAKKKKIAMFCTGGIRCEKASSYLIDEGFTEVYQLGGGILKYLEEIPIDQSQWEGECFVFDDRVSVDHHLKKGTYDLCHACRHPISTEDKASADYEKGLSCPFCFGKISEAKKKSLVERQRQVALAQARGEQHIGQKI